jgi:4-azaleucine resistance transporter AzlC
VSSAPLDPGTGRRRLLADLGGLAASAVAFGVVYGLAARAAGYSAVDTIVTSLIVFSGAAQFAAVGLVGAGVGWPLIIVTTLFLNARHLLYAAALRPAVADRSALERAGMAHVLTDEAFALATVHFRRIGRPDATGYWLAAIGSAFIPWNAGTIIGAVGGAAIPDPATFGLDVVFPAAMAGIAVALVGGRRELVAVAAGIAIAIGAALVIDPRLGIVVGGVFGPLIAMMAPIPDAVEPSPDATDRPPRRPEPLP